MLEERIKKNIEVLAALANNSNKSEVSQELLNQYSGWGGLKEAIYNPSVYTELKRYLNEEEINSVRKTLGSAYYTPELLVKFMWTALERMGFRKGEILEPAVGTGIFLDHMPEKVKQVSNIEAIEIDKVTCNILINKHPEVNLICPSFVISLAQ